MFPSGSGVILKMRQKKTLWMLLPAAVALLLIAAGLFQVLNVYRRYRENMLAYESRHLNSIASTGARGIDWMLMAYAGQVEDLTNRREFQRAEEIYLESGDVSAMRRSVSRPDAFRQFDRGSVAVFGPEGELVAASDELLPRDGENDLALGRGFLRTDDDGGFWFVFKAESAAGFRYEFGVTLQSMFTSQSEATRVGQNGYLFLLDRSGNFVAYAGNGVTEACSVEELFERFPSLTPAVFADLTGSELMMQGEYYVLRYTPSGGGGTQEAMVVTAPVISGGGELLLGTVVSFREFDSFLSDMLSEVTGVILMEAGGMLILFFLAAWLLVANRRNSLELAAVRERADLMEEVNRQQQSLAHTERLQQLGVMTSGVVHEFNNLLTPIMGQSMLLLEELADQPDTPAFEYALDIYEASENARDMTRRISAMSKRDVDLGFRALEVGGLLRKTMNLAAMARSPRIVQELKLPEGPTYLSGNEQLLTQALLNLCINACQAMEDEGVLSVSAEHEERAGRPYVTIRVSDTGPGIEEEKIGSLYDPFFTTKGERGTGLGLAICQKIIETHMGTIQAANRPEGGAVFTVRLPACDPPEEPEL